MISQHCDLIKGNQLGTCCWKETFSVDFFSVGQSRILQVVIFEIKIFSVENFKYGVNVYNETFVLTRACVYDELIIHIYIYTDLTYRITHFYTFFVFLFDFFRIIKIHCNFGGFGCPNDSSDWLGTTFFQFTVPILV